MDPGEQTTGTRDEHYNLVSVLYHALHGAENCDIYALDAEAAGSLGLSEFFREAQTRQRQLADEAKELLGIGGGVPGAADVPASGAVGGTMLESEVPPDLAPEDVPPGAVPEDVRPAAGVPSGTAPLPPDTAPPDDVARETPGGVPPGTEGVPPGTGPIDVPPEGEVPPDRMIPPPDDVAPPTDTVLPDETSPRDVPITEDVPPETDIQREAQVPADEVGVATERVPPTTDVPRTPPDAAAPGVGRPPEEDVVAEPTEPPVEEVSPLGDDTLAEEPPPPDTRRPGGAPMTEEVSPRPSETPPPAEGPPGAEKRTGDREYFTDLIRETDRRSRGQI